MDAAVAAVMTADFALDLNHGQTLWHRLDQIHSDHGSVDEFQHSVYAQGPGGRQQIDEAMQSLRHNPPAEVGQHRWRGVRDYHAHEIRSLPENITGSPLPNPSSDLLIFEAVAEDAIEVTLAVRPSGTEPKIKFYGFARQTTPGTGDTRAAILQLRDGLNTLLEQLIT